MFNKHRLTERQLKQKELWWAVEKKRIIRNQKIEDEKNTLLQKKKKTTTTKMLIGFLFLNCTAIEIFTGWAIVQSIQMSMMTGVAPDFTPLTALIGAIVGEVMGFAIYAAKSAKENSQGGIIYDNIMNNTNPTSNDEDNAVG